MAEDSVDLDALRDRFDLEPMPLEGGYFRQTWRGVEDENGRPAATAILVLLSAADDQFSAMHRLPTDEVWHFHSGDPVELLLLNESDRSHRKVLIGDPMADHSPQLVVPAGTWMGGRPVGDLGWSMFSCTMTPGFMDADYEGGDRDELIERFPDAAIDIAKLTRPGVALHHPDSSATLRGNMALGSF